MTIGIGRGQSNRACGRFLRDCGGATSVEYGLIAVLVTIGMLAGLKALGAGQQQQLEQYQQ